MRRCVLRGLARAPSEGQSGNERGTRGRANRAAVEVAMTVEAVRDDSRAVRLYWIIRDDSERLEGDLL
jgi:hypothetical protein